jgi:hypothetical protein
MHDNKELTLWDRMMGRSNMDGTPEAEKDLEAYYEKVDTEATQRARRAMAHLIRDIRALDVVK